MSPLFQMHFRRHRFGSHALAGLLSCLLSVTAWAEPSASEPFEAGVKAYRDGRYLEAKPIFEQLHRQRPEDSRLTYYLAMSEAQLGRFAQARALYEEIVKLDPNSEAAQLARQGVNYLPTDPDSLDLPPRFQAAPTTGTPVPSAVAGQTPGSPSMQDMMMWQMMMGQMGGNNNNGNGMSPMPFMMPPSATGENPMGQMDPNVMSSMMMNQMLQNFSLDTNKDNDR